MISSLICPYTGPYSVAGPGLHRGNTALALKRAMARLGFLPWTPEAWDEVYNQRLEDALDRWDPGKNGVGISGYGTGRWNKIRSARIPAGKPNAGSYALDAICLGLIQEEFAQTRSWIKVGPVFRAGVSILQHDLTHETSGIPLYPAFDDAFGAGIAIIAPEPITVTRASSSNPGDAFYADGVSGLRYWFGHLVLAPSVGSKFEKGQTVGKTCVNKQGGGPHVHVGVNVERLWGKGMQLLHRTNYTHGAPTVGSQLARGAPL